MTVEAPAIEFIPSVQQQDFFDFVEKGSGSCTLEAVAGAGKTTTLVRALGMMKGNVFFGAFNKKIVKEIRTKAEELGQMRDGIRIGTMHSAGFGAWRRMYPNVKVEENKTRQILEMKFGAHPELEATSTFIIKAVSLAKQLLLPRDLRADYQMQEWVEMVDRFSLDEELPDGVDIERGIRASAWTLEMSTRGLGSVIDFDDMIYAPIVHRVNMFKQDHLLIDEAQDTNKARRTLARMMLAKNGRLYAVGDVWQAIYGFTGADAGALDLISREFNCKRLKLTTTYRCPKAVVNFVHQWVDHIHAAETAPEGVVKSIPAKTDGKNWFEIEPLPAPTSAVLCRYTRPLIETAYAMLRAGMACRVEGRDIGKGLVSLINRLKARTLNNLEDKLDAWLAREERKAEEKKNPRRRDAAQDRVETIKIFIERTRTIGGKTPADVVLEINSLFADEISGILCLSTIHKAKGREWLTVYWLQAKQRHQFRHQWEEDSERACNYVSGTRAKQELFLVQEGS